MKTKLNRRTFLKELAVLGGASALGFLVPPSFAQLLTPEGKRPLEMLALGDSVIWGQGLKEEHKFVFMVREWLKQEIGNEVRLNFNHPHSGATIFPELDKDTNFDGEVNDSSPSILKQVENSLKDYKTRAVNPLDAAMVDLIIVDGGINDAQAVSIVISKRSTLTEKARIHCFNGMSVLLDKIAKTYPNARILVTGYFPLISTKTNPTELLDDILTVFGENKLQPVISLFGKKILNSVPGKLRLRTFLNDRSLTWYTESNKALKMAVEEFNAKNSLPLESVHFATDNPRVFFVDIPFGEANCYGVDGTTYLWRIRDKTQTNDERFGDRQIVCEEARNKNQLVKLASCHRAAAFHPNIEGAKAYRDAIQNKLRPILPLTGWASATVL